MLRRTRKAFWESKDVWVCPNHFPSSKIPANTEQCWYSNCKTKRPCKSTRPGVPDKPKIVKIDKPTKKQRRGSIEVSCAVCDIKLFRKPSDVKNNKSGTFFCCAKHSAEYRKNGYSKAS